MRRTKRRMPTRLCRRQRGWARRVDAGGDGLYALVHELLRHQSGRGGAVARLVVRLARHLLHELMPGVLKGTAGLTYGLKGKDVVPFLAANTPSDTKFGYWGEAYMLMYSDQYYPKAVDLHRTQPYLVIFSTGYSISYTHLYVVDI